jgi:FixJ family two-component response regulator
MPGVNGPDLVEQLRRRFPEIKALFMSGYTDHAVLANGALQAGVNFLQKPFVPEVLAKRVRAALDASPMNAEVPSSVAQLARV